MKEIYLFLILIFFAQSTFAVNSVATIQDTGIALHQETKQLRKSKRLKQKLKQHFKKIRVTKKQKYFTETNAKMHKMAITSFVLSMLGVVATFLIFNSGFAYILLMMISALLLLASLITGIIALAKIKKGQDYYRGKGLTWIGLGVFLLSIIFVLFLQ